VSGKSFKLTENANRTLLMLSWFFLITNFVFFFSAKRGNVYNINSIFPHSKTDIYSFFRSLPNLLKAED
jgi:hypothetical protein